MSIAERIKGARRIIGINAAATPNAIMAGVSSSGKTALQTHHVDSTLKQRGNGRFHVVSTWNPRGVFVGRCGIKHLNDSIKHIERLENRNVTIFLQLR